VKVELAKVAGFCMGVRRAVDIALTTARTGRKPVYTYGPLIHNPSAIALLEAQGVGILREIPEKGEGTVIIRAHGVPPEDKESLKAAGFDVVDATCSRVVKVQMLARHYARKGYTCVLVGDRGHPEVVGIMGHAGGRGILVSDEEEVDGLSGLDQYIIVAQTTQDRERFNRWCQRILARNPGGRVFDTICNSTGKRQAEARRLSSVVDAVVVVGGSESANTRRLAEIVAEVGRIAMAVETEGDLDRERLARFNRVGVTAGASTPNWVINGVVRGIEAISGAHEGAVKRWTNRGIRLLHETNLWTALAGAALGWSGCELLPGVVHPALGLALAFCYIYAMHTLNRLMDRETGRYTEPLRARFLIRHARAFYALSAASVAVSLAISWQAGMPSFIGLLAFTAFGILYTLPLLPEEATSRSMKDLPGSKTLFVAIAWASVTILVPSGVWPGEVEPVRWVLFGLTAALVYLRTAMMEIIDIQGDRLVGRETLAVLIGERRALMMIRMLAVGLAAASVALPLAGLVPWNLVSFLPVSLWILGLAQLFSGEKLGRQLKFEVLVEASFFVLLYTVLCVNAIAG
jgi:4-hydroxy-3-methylbut-2-enyl diphosphate reductase